MDIPKRPLGRPSRLASDHVAGRRSPTPLIHDIAPAQWTPRRPSLNQPVVQQVAPSASLPHPRPNPKKSRSKIWTQRLKKYGFVVATLLAVIVIVRLSATPSVGGLIIAVYAVGVLMLRIPSRVTFWLAALALVGVGIELLLLPVDGRVNNGALLVFLLLGVALVSSVFETRRIELKNKIFRR